MHADDNFVGVHSYISGTAPAHARICVYVCVCFFVRALHVLARAVCAFVYVRHCPFIHDGAWCCVYQRMVLCVCVCLFAAMPTRADMCLLVCMACGCDLYVLARLCVGLCSLP